MKNSQNWYNPLKVDSEKKPNMVKYHKYFRGIFFMSKNNSYSGEMKLEVVKAKIMGDSNTRLKRVLTLSLILK